MLFGKAYQVLNIDLFTAVADHAAVIATKHLMHFAHQQFDVRFGHAFEKGRELQVQAAVRSGHMPGFHKILRVILEFHVFQFVDLAV